MKSILKKSIYLALVFVFVVNLISVDTRAAVATPKFSVTVRDISGKQAAKVSGTINYTLVNRDGRYIFSRADVISSTDSKVTGLKKWKVTRVKDYLNYDKTRFLGEVEVEFTKDGIWYYGCASQEIELNPNTGVVTVIRSWETTENDW